MTDCAHVERRPPISVVLVWPVGAARPRAIPAESGPSPCISCSMLFDQVDAALQAKGITHWTRAIVIFEDGRGAELRHRQPAQAFAMA